jgi:hypothetical protein
LGECIGACVLLLQVAGGAGVVISEELMADNIAVRPSRPLRSGREFINAAIGHQGEKELPVLQQVRPEIWQVPNDETIQ